MPIHSSIDVDDRRLDAFRDIRNRNLTRMSGLFIAEGKLLVDRLLASDLRVHSIICEAKTLPRIEPLVDAETDVFVLNEGVIESLVGFDFHRGLMACGFRPAEIPFAKWLRQQSAEVERDSEATPEPAKLNEHGSAPFAADLNHQPPVRGRTLLVAVAVQDPENLGGILRSCAGLGIQDVLIGPECCDPFSRRVLRVSMGTVMKLNLVYLPSVTQALQELKTKLNYNSVATSLASDSIDLEQAGRPERLAILMGNEAHGLPMAVQAAADQRVKINMLLGTDSLNVSVAAGIVMHYFTRLAKLTVS